MGCFFHDRARAFLPVSLAILAVPAAFASLAVLTPAGHAETVSSSWIHKVEPARKAGRTPGAKDARKVKLRKIPASAPESKPGAELGASTKAQVPAKSTRLPGAFPAIPPDTGHDPVFAAFEAGAYVTTYKRAYAAAGRDDPAAHTMLGRLYDEGLGVVQDPARAARWYKNGVELGDENAAYQLGLLYATGRGVATDKKRAADLFAIAAERGHLTSTYNLALAFLSGDGRTQDLRGGIRLLTTAAEGGSRAAMYDLGTLYATGQGVVKDPVKAAQWTGSAARKGLVSAQLEYAVMLFKGRGVEKNQTRALWYFRAAAERGNPVAQNRLARLNAYGVATERAPVAAAKWHLLARAAGVSDFNLDIVLSRLDDDERDKAEEAASAWRDRNLALD